jgi:hypothetical protein
VAEVIVEVVNSRPLNHNTVGSLTWWKEHYGHHLCLMLDKTSIRAALKGLSEGQAHQGNGKGRKSATTRPRTPATINRYKTALSTAFE